ncbi:hypothetical protein J4471_03690 [Candidatus Woesearchaeota archaeon]|nr:hypothetical protein [Candidatus Woesearchaeota archaeon]
MIRKGSSLRHIMLSAGLIGIIAACDNDKAMEKSDPSIEYIPEPMPVITSRYEFSIRGHDDFHFELNRHIYEVQLLEVDKDSTAVDAYNVKFKINDRFVYHKGIRNGTEAQFIYLDRGEPSNIDNADALLELKFAQGRLIPTYVENECNLNEEVGIASFNISRMR